MLKSIDRLANLLKLTSAEKVWNAVRHIKLDSSKKSLEEKETCLEWFNWYQDMDKLYKVIEVEQKLGINSSNIRFLNMTRADLKIAAHMFIHLTTCAPFTTSKYTDDGYWFKSWAILYIDLFKTKSPDQIILTLNRILKDKSPENKDGIDRAKKLFNRISKLLSLKYKGIQSMFPRIEGNISAEIINYKKEGRTHIIGTFCTLIIYSIV